VTASVNCYQSTVAWLPAMMTQQFSQALLLPCCGCAWLVMVEVGLAYIRCNFHCALLPKHSSPTGFVHMFLVSAW